MIEFMSFSWIFRMFITVLLGVCVLAQTLAIVLNHHSKRLSTRLMFENALEIIILFEILIFSLMHGQIVSGYKNGFIVATGYENLRTFMFFITLILIILVTSLSKKVFPLIVIPAAIISLPAAEIILAEFFPWFFISSLILFLIRSIVIIISSIRTIRTNISALSVKHAIDTLHTGVLFSENDGHILISNKKMQDLMIIIANKIYRNAIDFYEMIVSNEFNLRYDKAKLDGHKVYILGDGSAWMFTKTDVTIKMKNYIHISASDVTDIWKLTSQLQMQDEELRDKSQELKEAIKNLHILSKKKEIENAKMRAHDILGQKLSVLLRTIQTEESIDYDLLVSLSNGLLKELKSDQIETGPYDELKSIQQIFSAIGVDIQFEGEFPKDSEKARLFVDIIREGSTNAVRHGFATKISIKVRPAKNAYKLIINNNGHPPINPIVPGSGLGVMRKKVSAQGGNLNIIEKPLFTLSVVIPGGD
ncbi:MAG: hypothetical protein GX752_02575 [Clostridium sp.]|nr:hypothetical protein [Clostridium sp.]